MRLKFLLGLSVVALGAVVAVARQPSEYRVTRTARINATPAALFPRVEDLKKFNEWNPWIKLDPTAQVTYYGEASGPGASMAWAGNSNVGEGRMTVIETRPHELVKIRLDFEKPLANTATAEFTFAPSAGGTSVTWSMSGHNNTMGKAIGLVMDMERMIGGQFERGLADLKSLTEATAKETGR